jgi:hypothetical protein
MAPSTHRRRRLHGRGLGASDSATNPSQRQIRVSDKSESATNPSRRQIRVSDKSGPARAWTGPATPRACGPGPPLWPSYGSAVLPVGAPWSRPHKESRSLVELGPPRWTPRWGHLVRTPQDGQPGSPAFAQGLRPMPRGPGRRQLSCGSAVLTVGTPSALGIRRFQDHCGGRSFDHCGGRSFAMAITVAGPSPKRFIGCV